MGGHHRSSHLRRKSSVRRPEWWGNSWIGCRRNIGVARAIDSDSPALVAVTSAQVGGIDQGGAGGVQLTYKGISGFWRESREAAESGLEGSGGGGEIEDRCRL